MLLRTNLLWAIPPGRVPVSVLPSRLNTKHNGLVAAPRAGFPLCSVIVSVSVFPDIFQVPTFCIAAAPVRPSVDVNVPHDFSLKLTRTLATSASSRSNRFRWSRLAWSGSFVRAATRRPRQVPTTLLAPTVALAIIVNASATDNIRFAVSMRWSLSEPGDEPRFAPREGSRR